MTAALVAALNAEHFRVRQVVPGLMFEGVDTDRFEADLSSPESLRELHERLAGTDRTPVGAVVNCLGLSEPFNQPGCDHEDLPVQVTLWTLNVLKELIDDLCRSASAGGGWFVNITPLGGEFGLDDIATNRSLALAAAGTLGIGKALQREYATLQVKNVDVDATLEPAMLAQRLVQEIAGDDPLREVGLTRKGRWRLDLEKAPLPARLGSLPVGPESVILITGGGKGVTAGVATALAAAERPHLVLVGSSAMPQPETPKTVALDRMALRRHLVEQARAEGTAPVPAEIEKAVNRILKEREFGASL